MDWSLQEAKRQGMPLGSHYCDYLLFLDADQVSRSQRFMLPFSPLQWRKTDNFTRASSAYVGIIGCSPLSSETRTDVACPAH